MKSPESRETTGQWARKIPMHQKPKSRIAYDARMYGMFISGGEKPKINVAAIKESRKDNVPSNTFVRVRIVRMVKSKVGLPTINSSDPSRRSARISKKDVNNTVLHMPMTPLPMIVWMKSMLVRPAVRARKYPTALKMAGWVTIVPKENSVRVRIRS